MYVFSIRISVCSCSSRLNLLCKAGVHQLFCIAGSAVDGTVEMGSELNRMIIVRLAAANTGTVAIVLHVYTIILLKTINQISFWSTVLTQYKRRKTVKTDGSMGI